MIYLFQRIWLQLFLLTVRLHESEIKILEDNSRFYKALNPNQRKRFEKKVCYFMRHKEFIPMKMDQVTEEMKILISAAAVQLTFGLPYLRLPVFPRIMVFPKKFFNSKTGKYHVGEVNTMGIIALSWEDFKKGFLYATDGMNVALHELAHALQFEDAIDNDEHAFLDVKTLRKINLQYQIEKQRNLSGEPVFLRNYAFQNSQEFFAVAVEAFFERTKQFKEAMPELFGLMKELLRLDPLNLAIKK